MASAILQNVAPSTLLDTSGLCLLSLDGDGIRGYSSLLVLKRLMDMVNTLRRDAGLSSVKPCDVFDLIGGSGVGGLIAIMLGRLRMSVEDCLDELTKMSFSVFGTNPRKGMLLNQRHRFNYTILEKVFEKVATRARVSATDAFREDEPSKTRTVVFVAGGNTSRKEPTRSYAPPLRAEKGAFELSVWQAARATSAAPTYFSQTSCSKHLSADDEAAYRRPTAITNSIQEVENEAGAIWAAETGDLQPLVKCLVSIGPGLHDDTPDFVFSSGAGPFDQERETPADDMESSRLPLVGSKVDGTTATHWARRSNIHRDKSQYYCISLKVSKDLEDLDSFSRECASGSIPLLAPEVIRDLKVCALNLQQKQEKTPMNFAKLIIEDTAQAYTRQLSLARRPLDEQYAKSLCTSNHATRPLSSDLRPSSPESYYSTLESPIHSPRGTSPLQSLPSISRLQFQGFASPSMVFPIGEGSSLRAQQLTSTEPRQTLLVSARPDAGSQVELRGARHTPCLGKRPCYPILAFMFFVIAGSAAFAMYWTLRTGAMGDGFTAASWLVAVGTLIVAVPVARHYQHCRCWKRIDRAYVSGPCRVDTMEIDYLRRPAARR